MCRMYSLSIKKIDFENYLLHSNGRDRISLSRWETDSVIKHVTDIEISSEKSKLVSLRNTPKKRLYMLAFDYWFSYDDHDPRV